MHIFNAKRQPFRVCFSFKTNSFKRCLGSSAAKHFCCPSHEATTSCETPLAPILSCSIHLTCIICVSCFGFDFLSFSLSIISFNSIISSCFGGCSKCAHPSATRLDSQFFYLYSLFIRRNELIVVDKSSSRNPARLAGQIIEPVSGAIIKTNHRAGIRHI